MAAEDYLSSQMGFRSANSEAALVLCAKKGLHGIAALLLTAEGCVLVALRARERVAGCTVCAAGLRQSVQGSWQVWAGTEGQLLVLLPG